LRAESLVNASHVEARAPVRGDDACRAGGATLRAMEDGGAVEPGADVLTGAPEEFSSNPRNVGQKKVAITPISSKPFNSP
jgi:hypothetical protein